MWELLSTTYTNTAWPQSTLWLWGWLLNMWANTKFWIILLEWNPEPNSGTDFFKKLLILNKSVKTKFWMIMFSSMFVVTLEYSYYIKSTGLSSYAYRSIVTTVLLIIDDNWFCFFNLFSVFVVQVEYTYPGQTNFSAGAKDLVAKLLKHNPMHRLPIKGVLSHPWVVECSTKKPTTLNNEEPSRWAF